MHVVNRHAGKGVFIISVRQTRQSECHKSPQMALLVHELIPLQALRFLYLSDITVSLK